MEINTLFETRNKNCETKASNYWMKQPRKEMTTVSTYDDELKQYWSPDMVKFLQYNNQETLDLLVMIISVRRRHGSYLQHNARLLHQQIEKVNSKIQNEESKKVDLVVCNSDAVLNEHKEALYLSDYVDMIPISKTKRSHKCCPAETCDYEAQRNSSKSKEIADYYECVKEAKNRYRFKYLLVLEDDAEPSTPKTIEQIIHSIIPLVMNENEDVILAKLFYSFGYQGFSMTFESFVEVLCSYVATVFMVYSLNVFYKRLKLHRLEHNVRKQELSDHIVLAIAISSILFIVVFALGRQSTLLPLKNKLVPYQISKAHQDQTTAILYPRTKLSELLNLMDNSFICSTSEEDEEKNGKVEIDLQLANVIDKQHKERRSMIWIHGDFFNHIGFFTSLHFKDLHVETQQFISRYVFLPDIYCNYP